MPTAAPNPSPSSYPLTHSLATTIADTHHQSLKELETTLASLTEAHTSCPPSSGPITDCVTHGGPWRSAFKAFYLPTSTQPTGEHPIKRTWMGCRPEAFVQEIEAMFEREDLATINERVDRERRAHVKDSQVVSAGWESKAVRKMRRKAGELWMVGKEEKAGELIVDYGEKIRERLDWYMDPTRKKKELAWDKAETRQEQRELLKRFVCDAQEGDTDADKALRVKWARLFDSEKEYGDIVEAIRHDVAKAQERVAEMDNKLADLQSAYMAETKKKEVEAEERRRVERENERHCEGCQKELEVVEEGMCCERCWETRRDEEGRLRVGWYCGEECAKTDAARHNVQYHDAPRPA